MALARGVLIGSDFAGGHAQYERFYMGPACVVREHVGREIDWSTTLDPLDELLASYDDDVSPELIGRAIETS